MFKLLGFIFQEGSSLLFAGLIVAFAMMDLPALELPQDHIGMFVITVVSLIYLALQMSMASFAAVGQDRPLVDLFFSFIPAFAMVVIVVLAAVNAIELTQFDVLGLVIASLVVVMDIIFNTQVLFKMNRLATDLVQMK